MLADVLPFLACPVCGGGLSPGDRSVRCERGHAFDVARQGYVNLQAGGGGPGTADTATMVAARQAVFAAGHYETVVDAVASAAEQAADAEAGERSNARQATGCVVDLGAGTGEYLAAALDRLPGRVGLALELSKHALRRAARAHPRIGAVGCNVWRPLPVMDGAAALVLNVFAPRNGAEIARILRPDGRLLVVTPTPRHLRELVEAVGLISVDEHKQERLDAQLDPHLAHVGATGCEFAVALSREDAAAMIHMGPNARHLDAATVADRLSRLPEPVTVTVSVLLATYRRH